MKIDCIHGRAITLMENILDIIFHVVFFSLSYILTLKLQSLIKINHLLHYFLLGQFYYHLYLSYLLERINTDNLLTFLWSDVSTIKLFWKSKQLLNRSQTQLVFTSSVLWLSQSVQSSKRRHRIRFINDSAMLLSYWIWLSYK